MAAIFLIVPSLLLLFNASELLLLFGLASFKMSTITYTITSVEHTCNCHNKYIAKAVKQDSEMLLVVAPHVAVFSLLHGRFIHTGLGAGTAIH